MNSGLNWLVALIMAAALSACATGGSVAPAADAQPSSTPVINDEPECD